MTGDFPSRRHCGHNAPDRVTFDCLKQSNTYARLRKEASALLTRVRNGFDIPKSSS